MRPSKRTVLILTGVILMGLAALLARLFLPPKPVPLANIKFPVLVVRENHRDIYIEPVPEGLVKIRMSSPRVPIGGTIIIDSDLRFYTQQNIDSTDSEIKSLFRALVNPTSEMTFTFDLMPRKESGPAAAREKILACESLDTDKDEDARKRAEIAKQTTLAGMIAVLESDESAPLPTAEPAEDE